LWSRFRDRRSSSGDSVVVGSGDAGAFSAGVSLLLLRFLVETGCGGCQPAPTSVIRKLNDVSILDQPMQIGQHAVFRGRITGAGVAGALASGETLDAAAAASTAGGVISAGAAGGVQNARSTVCVYSRHARARTR